MSEKRIIIDVSTIRGGKTSYGYYKRCIEYCTHYDIITEDCYLGNNMYEKCDDYKPKHTGMLQSSVGEI